MFDYSRSVFVKTINDLKNIAFFSALSLQLFQLAYLIYALCIGSGIFVANVILLALTIAYLGFILYIHWNTIAKKTKKILNNIYHWSKRLIKLFTLGVSVYGLYITASETVTAKSLLSIILLVFMIIAWILELLFSILIIVLENRKDLFFNAMKMDIEPILKAKSFFDKITGKEVENEIVPAKTRDILEKLNEKREEQEKQKKLEQKKERREKIAGFFSSIFKKSN